MSAQEVEPLLPEARRRKIFRLLVTAQDPFPASCERSPSTQGREKTNAYSFSLIT
jgi:hypothetical protein